MSIATLDQRLARFHQEPFRDDRALDQGVESCRHHAVAGGRDVFATAAGQPIALAERAAVPARPASQPQGAMATGRGAASAPLLFVDDALAILRLVSLTLRPEGGRVVSASAGEAAREMARAARPDLVLPDWHRPRRAGREVCRARHAESALARCDVPVVRRTAQAGAAATTAGGGAGGTAAGTTPGTPAHLRSHVPTWLRRTRAGQEGT
jgi:CheY-like chemotaxis protein